MEHTPAHATLSMSLVPPLLTTQEPIQIHIASDKAYVYDVESIRRLRVDHHITGITLGTLPQVAQQNVFLGVPLQLLPEEVAVLVEERELVSHSDFSYLEMDDSVKC